jgi:formylglycine-generating enzyme required for sulfatase activity
MKSPFPGMDPYLERHWGDVHGYHRQLVLAGAAQGQWQQATVDMTAVRQPDGTHQVGQKLANPFGLCDIQGNAHEWVADWFREEYYGESSPVDPTGPVTGEFRVIRGGNWGLAEPFCRSAVRGRAAPTAASAIGGFRIAREVEQPAPSAGR